MSKTRSNEEWLHDLNSMGSAQEAALADLRDLLLHAALYFFTRNLSDFQGLSREEILQRAEDCAQDALLAVLDHLSEFRGDSKFSTWAYKFAINMAMMAARRERWKAVSLDDLASFDEVNLVEHLVQHASEEAAPERSAMQVEVQRILQEVLERDLTERQRSVLMMMLVHDVPLDEVVRHHGTNRNAVYKLLHDARLKLKAGLRARGFEVGETITLFGSSK
jgi:RNA polymerase sigma-70 factor (ECF subfamily)